MNSGSPLHEKPKDLGLTPDEVRAAMEEVRKRNNAKDRDRRANRTEEEKTTDNIKRKERRANWTEEQKANESAKGKERWANYSEEKKSEMNARAVERQAKQRLNRSEEKKADDNARVREQRANRSEEKKEEVKAYDRERKAAAYAAANLGNEERKKEKALPKEKLNHKRKWDEISDDQSAMGASAKPSTFSHCHRFKISSDQTSTPTTFSYHDKTRGWN